MDSRIDLDLEIELLNERIARLTREGKISRRRASEGLERMGDKTLGEATRREGSPRGLGHVTSEGHQHHTSNSAPLTKPIVSPDPFNGQGSYRDWFTHFEACRTINGWTDEQACQFLAAKLRGTALRVYTDLAPFERLDYESVTTALKTRFDPERDTGVYWTQLRERSRRRGESLGDLADAIQRLAARAYPDSDSSTRGTIEIQHFIEALDNREIQKQLRRSKPSSLGEAVRMALDEESYDRLDGAAKARSAVGVSSLMENTSNPTGAEPDSELAKLIKKVENLEQQVSRRVPYRDQPAPGPGPYPPPYNGQAPRGPRCYRCNEWGHMQRECPLN